MNNKIQKNSIKAWFLAIRPKTLSAAIIPVITASALAYSKGKFIYEPALICLLFAALMQIASNLINDLYDFLKGTDNENRLGPLRACAQGWISPKAMRIGIIICLVLACSVGLILLFYWSWKLIFIGAFCVVFAFLYTTTLSYIGLGDLLVWIFFGLVPVSGTYFVITGSLVPEVWWLSALCGIGINTLLILNNYRDRTTDKESGKNTLIVKFGEPFGRYFYFYSGFIAYFLGIVLSFYSYIWLPILLLPYLIIHYLTWKKMIIIFEGKELNKILGATARNLLLLGILTTLGLIIK